MKKNLIQSFFFNMNKFGVFKSCLIIFQIPLWGWKQAHSTKWQNKNKNITLSDCAQLFTIWHIFEKNKIHWTELQCRIKIKTIQQVITDAKQICVVFVSWTEQSSKKYLQLKLQSYTKALLCYQFTSSLILSTLSPCMVSAATASRHAYTFPHPS